MRYLITILLIFVAVCAYAQPTTPVIHQVTMIRLDGQTIDVLDTTVVDDHTHIPSSGALIKAITGLIDSVSYVNDTMKFFHLYNGEIDTFEVASTWLKPSLIANDVIIPSANDLRFGSGTDTMRLSVNSLEYESPTAYTTMFEGYGYFYGGGGNHEIEFTTSSFPRLDLRDANGQEIHLYASDVTTILDMYDAYGNEVALTPAALYGPNLTYAQLGNIYIDANFDTIGTIGYVLAHGTDGQFRPIDPNTLVSGDNLGNHTATQNLDLFTYKLVGEGGSDGIYVDFGGNVGIKLVPTEAYDFEVNGTGYFSDDLELGGALIDGLGSPGTSGQLLGSTVTGIDWVDNPVSGTQYAIPYFTTSSTLGDSPLTWDGTTHIMSITDGTYFNYVEHTADQINWAVINVGNGDQSTINVTPTVVALSAQEKMLIATDTLSISYPGGISQFKVQNYEWFASQDTTGLDGYVQTFNSATGRIQLSNPNTLIDTTAKLLDIITAPFPTDSTVVVDDSQINIDQIPVENREVFINGLLVHNYTVSDSLLTFQGYTLGSGDVVTVRFNATASIIAAGSDNLGNHILTENLKTAGFWVSNDGGNEGMFVQTNGGIVFGSGSTVNPFAFNFEHTAANSSLIRVENLSANGYTGMQFVNDAGNQAGFGIGNSAAYVNSNEVYFSVIDAIPFVIKTNNTERMRILSTGEVGINTSTPSLKLDVVADSVRFGNAIFDVSAAPTNGQVMMFNNTTNHYEPTSISGSGFGDNLGSASPGSSTDNAIVRWDGTGADALQNSGIKISDAGSIQMTDNYIPNKYNSNAGTGFHRIKTGITIDPASVDRNIILELNFVQFSNVTNERNIGTIYIFCSWEGNTFQFERQKVVVDGFLDLTNEVEFMLDDITGELNIFLGASTDAGDPAIWLKHVHIDNPDANNYFDLSEFAVSRTSVKTGFTLNNSTEWQQKGLVAGAAVTRLAGGGEQNSLLTLANTKNATDLTEVSLQLIPLSGTSSGASGGVYETRGAFVKSRYIASRGDFDLILGAAPSASAGSDVVTITGGGNVGILNSNPNYEMHVNGNTKSQVFRSDPGSVSNAAYSKDGDSNTGAYFPAADQYAIATGGVERINVDATGLVTIGERGTIQTASPVTGRYPWKLFSESGDNGTLELQRGGVTYVHLSGNDGDNYINVQSASGMAIGLSDANERLHVGNTSATTVGVKITDSTTGTGATDGFSLRSVSGEARVMQLENLPMTFYTNATEKMRLDQNGNLGIGTTSPEARLHIATEVNTDDAWQVFQSSTSGNSYGPALVFKRSLGTIASPTQITSGVRIGALFIEGHNDVAWEGQRRVMEINASETWTSTNGGFEWSFFTRPNGTVGSPTEIMRLANYGYVGIGTPTPLEKLHIVDGDLLLSSSSYIEMKINQTDSGTLSYGVTSGSGKAFISSVSNNPSTGGYRWLLASSEVMNLNEDGNLSIGNGTIEATYKLEVNGTSAATTLRTTSTGSAASPSIQLNDDNTGIHGGADVLRFTTGGVEAMQISSGQDIGINGTAITGRQLTIHGGAGVAYIALVNSTTGTTSNDGFQYALSSDDINIINREPAGSMFFRVNDTTDAISILSSGDVGIANASPTAKLHIGAGTATANTAPLKFTSGTNLTTPEAGAVEYDGTNFYATNSTNTRYTLVKALTGSATLDFPNTLTNTSSTLTITVTGAADGDPVVLGIPNASALANGLFSARVSAANTVTVKFNNYSGGAQDPASGTFKVTVIKQ